MTCAIMSTSDPH